MWLADFEAVIVGWIHQGTPSEAHLPIVNLAAGPVVGAAVIEAAVTVTLEGPFGLEDLSRGARLNMGGKKHSREIDENEWMKWEGT